MNGWRNENIYDCEWRWGYNSKSRSILECAALFSGNLIRKNINYKGILSIVREIYL